MSQKITSKNLSYDTTLPPFLARLHGQHQQHLSSDSPDPILAARRRPGARVRSASEEAEDAPLVVDERGNVVQLDVDEESGDVVKGEEGSNTKEEAGGGDDGEKGKESTARAAGSKDAAVKVAGIGAGKKRKVGRVIGVGEDGDDESREADSKRVATKTTESDAKPTTSAKQPPKKKAKKKKIQLSFGDDGGE